MFNESTDYYNQVMQSYEYSEVFIKAKVGICLLAYREVFSFAANIGDATVVARVLSDPNNPYFVQICGKYQLTPRELALFMLFATEAMGFNKE